MSGGGKDRKIIEWDAELQKTGFEVEVKMLEKISFYRLRCTVKVLLQSINK